VVGSAAEGEVVEVGFSAFGPGFEVVDVAPGWGSFASGVGAVPVPGDDRPGEVGRDRPGGAAEVDWLVSGSEDDSGDIGVAGDTVDLALGEDEAVSGFVESTHFAI